MLLRSGRLPRVAAVLLAALVITAVGLGGPAGSAASGGLAAQTDQAARAALADSAALSDSAALAGLVGHAALAGPATHAALAGPATHATTAVPAAPAGPVLPTAHAASAAPGSPALTPPLGWNSWNSFGCGITEAQVRQAADAMVSTGMRDAGYQYVVVDDCWFDPQRDPAGNLRSHPSKFPSGMKALGDYIHARGLKFGIYQAPNEKTCAQGTGAHPGSTGSKGHEVQDARSFASWGVDYLKYDWCSGAGSRDEQVARFTIMRDALRGTGRPIVYSINPNSFHPITGDRYNWGEVADLWRTTEDLLDIWQNGNVNSYPMGVGNVVDVTAPLAVQSGPGHWNDPDMLVVGRPGLSLTEARAHFALWALMAAPLMAGNDIRTMSADVSAILRNPRLLAVNQDGLGAGGRRVRDDGATEVFAKPLADGSVAIGLFNRGNATATVSTTAAQIGLSGNGFTLTDLWTGGTSTTSGAISAAVPAHGVAAYRVTGGSPLNGTTARLRGAGANRCLDLENGSTAAGANTTIWDCHTAASQQWTSWPNGEIRVFGDKCLDAYDQGTANGTRVISWQCNGQANQRWTLGSDGTVRNVNAGLCLDVERAGTANGSRLVLWTCNGQTNQRWSRS